MTVTRIPGMRRFLTRTAIGSLPIVAIIGLCVYYYYGVRPSLYGDLGVLGREQFDAGYNRSQHAAPFGGNLMVDTYHDGDTLTRVVTIGDSFSQQDSIGYQNALAHLMGERVTNLPIDVSTSGPVPAAFALLRSGFFERNKGAEVVIFELVERSFPPSLNAIDEERIAAAATTFPHPDGDAAPAKGENLPASIIHQGIDWLRLRTGLEKNPVMSAELTRPLFTIPGKECRLYFYRDDLQTLGAPPDMWGRMRHNVELLHDEFARAGLRMIFFVVPDKYEVYQPYIVPGTLSEKRFGLEMADALAGMDYVVQALPEARKRLAAGEKDLYMADDTHWAAKGSMMAAELLLPHVAPADSVR